MNFGKAVAEVNAAYEADLREHVAKADARSAYDVDLSEPFFGIEWGVMEWNVQRQKWRWLGPLGRSHLFLKLAPGTDYIVRARIHTAASIQILEALHAYVNGTRCKKQRYDWGADGVPTHWCILPRDLIAKQQGIAKITWSLLRREEEPRTLGTGDGSAQLEFARAIAFSRITCEPYPPR